MPVVSDANPRDRMASGGGVIAPPVQQCQQRIPVRRQLLQRLARQPRNQTADQPARAAQFDYRNQRAILIQSDEDRLRSSHFGMGHSIGKGFKHPMVPFPRGLPHRI
jgi:hypothetical protein